MRLFLRVFLYLFLLTLPASAQVFSPETFTLENGLCVVVLPNDRAPVVTQMIWVNAGSARDPVGHSGVAHFLEHLMFKGTKNTAEGVYSQTVARLGGQENAMTSYDFTAYYATFAKQHLEKIMALEADRFGFWQVTDAQVASERKVILKERQQVTEDNPVGAFWEQVNAKLYRGAYQRPVIGWRAEMEKLSRQDVEHFFDTYYQPRNMTLVLSGDVRAKDVRPLVEKYFGSLKNRNRTREETIMKTIMPQMTTINSQQKKAVQATSPLVRETIWTRSFHVLPARPKTIAISDAQMVLAKILGDGRTGRLYQELIVKQKLATHAAVNFDVTAKEIARFTVMIVPTPQLSQARIAKAVDAEIKKLLTQGVTAQEVADATQALQIETIYARDSVSGPAFFVGGALTAGLDVATIESWPQRMRAVTVARVNAAAKELFAQQAFDAVLSPAAVKEAK